MGLGEGEIKRWPNPLLVLKLEDAHHLKCDEKSLIKESDQYQTWKIV
jgi:hypothetical protein